jgi:hypothetical protein
VLYNLGLVAARRGDAEGAATALAECLGLRAAQGNVAEIAKTITAAADVALLRGEAERAARLWGAAEGIRAAHGMPAPTDEDGEAEQRLVTRARAALGATAFANAVAQGTALSPPQATDLASETLHDTRHPAA